MRYKLIKQEPYCCVPRCLQMIFDKNNIPYDSQIEMAQELGLINDQEYKGTQVNKEEYSITNYLKKHKIPLSFKYFFITDYNEAKMFLSKYIEDDIIVCYKRGVMFNKQMEGGHATLIEKIKDDSITLIYPEDDQGYRVVTLEKMLEAIKCHGKENMAGFWLFENIK
ncbi:MAG: hypothetical protein IJO33_04955 [Bacilli bacterium]|nr:hypothetical protein [Bacilli bacterium]